MPSIWTLEIGAIRAGRLLHHGRRTLFDTARIERPHGPLLRVSGPTGSKRLKFDAFTVLFLIFYLLACCSMADWDPPPTRSVISVISRSSFSPDLSPARKTRDGWSAAQRHGDPICGRSRAMMCLRDLPDAPAGDLRACSRTSSSCAREDAYVSHEMIALFDVCIDDAHAPYRAARVRRHRCGRRRLPPWRYGEPAAPNIRLRLGSHEAHEVVSAADAADVHLHGLRAFGIQDRRRPLQDVSRLDGPGAWRTRHRDNRPDDPHFRDERISPSRAWPSARRLPCPNS